MDFGGIHIPVTTSNYKRMPCKNLQKLAGRPGWILTGELKASPSFPPPPPPPSAIAPVPCCRCCPEPGRQGAAGKLVGQLQAELQGAALPCSPHCPAWLAAVLHCETSHKEMASPHRLPAAGGGSVKQTAFAKEKTWQRKVFRILTFSRVRWRCCKALVCPRNTLSCATQHRLVVETTKSTSCLGWVVPLVLLFHFSFFENVIILPPAPTPAQRKIHFLHRRKIQVGGFFQ